MSGYAEFLAARAQLAAGDGPELAWMPDGAFGFQTDLVAWALRRGRAALFADCGMGKAQPVDEPVLTPTGWRAIGDLAAGDEVIGVNGAATRVVGTFPQGFRDIVRVTFNDGASTRCDIDHLWTVATDLDMSRGRPWRTLTSGELIRRGLKDPAGRWRWRIPIVRPVAHGHRDMPVDPYVLGVLLGDGSFRSAYGPSFTVADDWIAGEVKNRLPGGMRLSRETDRGRTPTYRPVQLAHPGSGGRTNPILHALREWGLQGAYSHEKFIPAEYLVASIPQRLDLLRGLLDTDGYVSDQQMTVQFYSSSPRLVDGVLALVRSLGGVARRHGKTPTYQYQGERRTGRHHETLTIALPDGMAPFSLPRKAQRCRDRYYVPQRKIIAIEPIGTAAAVCIAVEHPSALYVTRDYLVTHNTLMELSWAFNVHKHTGRRVLLATPLAVAFQVVSEGERWGVDVAVSRDGRPSDAPVTVTNYEQLHKFDPSDFVGTVCDESSAIKSFDGTTRAVVTEFLRTQPYRLLATATAAPNDYTELGTSSEALGELGLLDMLNRFFTNRNRTSDMKGHFKGRAAPRQYMGPEFRFKGHAETPFWRWVASWARALRRPSDLGYDDGPFVLPALEIRRHLVEPRSAAPGLLFDLPVGGLIAEREELRRTIPERCEVVADLLADADRAVAWCHLNDESQRLTRTIPGAVELTGSMPVEEKENILRAFSSGQIRVLVSKPRIGAWGLNWQHAHQMTYFPSHSYEEHYQAVRRMWRFGQTSPVTVDMVLTPAQTGIAGNLRRKSEQADAMFAALVTHMRDAETLRIPDPHVRAMEAPAWL